MKEFRDEMVDLAERIDSAERTLTKVRERGVAAAVGLERRRP